MASAFLELTNALLDDPAAKAGFDADPQGFLAQRGPAGLTATEVAEALDYAADALPAPVALALDGVVLDGPDPTGFEGALQQLRQVAAIDPTTLPDLPLDPGNEPFDTAVVDLDDRTVAAVLGGTDPSLLDDLDTPSPTADATDTGGGHGEALDDGVGHGPGIDPADPTPPEGRDAGDPAPSPGDGPADLEYGGGSPDAADPPAEPADTATDPVDDGEPSDWFGQDPAGVDDGELAVEQPPISVEPAEAPADEPEAFDDTDLDPRDDIDVDLG